MSDFRAYGFQTLYEFRRTLVVFEMFDDVHHNVVVVELAKAFDH
jgi:hypothetical protein